MAIKFLRECGDADIATLYDIQNSSENSFSLLHSVFGYTQTEWGIEYKKGGDKQSFVISEKGNDYGYIRLKRNDDVSQSVELQLNVREVKAGSLDISDVITEIMYQMEKYKNITRFYSFVFDHEIEEKKVLEDSGFAKEAVFDDHIFSQGRYLDVLVYGLERGVI